MSISPSSNAATAPTAYQDLHIRCESKAPALQQENLNTLPGNLTYVILDNISGQAEGLVKSDRKNVYEFDSSPSEQQVVDKVATIVLSSPDRIKESRTVSGIPDDNEQRSLEDDNMDTLTPSSMDTTIHIGFPKVEQILNLWVAQGDCQEKRAEAALRIRAFLNHKTERSLILSYLCLKSSPDIFAEEPFISRLQILNLSFNSLEQLSKTISCCKQLSALQIYANPLLSQIPWEIARLPKLEQIWISHDMRSLLNPLNQIREGYQPQADRQIKKDQFVFGISDDMATPTSSYLLTPLPHIIWDGSFDLWVAQGDIEENRAEAKLRMIYFLRDPQATLLDLSYLRLKSLPDCLLNDQSFISRIQNLNLSFNSLRELPGVIYDCSQLITLDISKNPLESNIDARIRQHPRLKQLLISNNRCSLLPGPLFKEDGDDCLSF